MTCSFEVPNLIKVIIKRDRMRGYGAYYFQKRFFDEVVDSLQISLDNQWLAQPETRAHIVFEASFDLLNFSII